MYDQLSQDFLAFIFYFNVTLTAGFISILHLMNRVLFEDNKGWEALVYYITTINLISLIQFFIKNVLLKIVCATR